MTVDLATYFRIQQFLYLEARLMDGHCYDEWQSLWDDEPDYWIPCNADDVDRTQHISLVNENAVGLKDRITRLKSPANFAQHPPSRTCHVIGNIEVQTPDGDGLTEVYSTLILTSSQRGKVETLAGQVTHRLIVTDDEIIIKSKKVVLVNNDEVFGNLTYLV